MAHAPAQAWKRGDTVLAISKGIYDTYCHELYEARVLKVHKIGTAKYPRYLLDLRFSNNGTKEYKTPTFRNRVACVIPDDDPARGDTDWESDTDDDDAVPASTPSQSPVNQSASVIVQEDAGTPPQSPANQSAPATQVPTTPPGLESVHPDVDWMIRAGHDRLMKARTKHTPPVIYREALNKENADQLYKAERKERMQQELAARLGLKPDDPALTKPLKRKLFEMTHPAHEALLTKQPPKKTKKEKANTEVRVTPPPPH